MREMSKLSQKIAPQQSAPVRLDFNSIVNELVKLFIRQIRLTDDVTTLNISLNRLQTCKLQNPPKISHLGILFLSMGVTPRRRALIS